MCWRSARRTRTGSPSLTRGLATAYLWSRAGQRGSQRPQSCSAQSHLSLTSTRSTLSSPRYIGWSKARRREPNSTSPMHIQTVPASWRGPHGNGRRYSKDACSRPALPRRWDEGFRPKSGARAPRAGEPRTCYSEASVTGRSMASSTGGWALSCWRRCSTRRSSPGSMPT